MHPPQHGAVFTRVTSDGIGEVFRGFDDGKPAILVLCATRPPPAPEMSALTVARAARADGRWQIMIGLGRAELASVFSDLALDLARAANAAAGPEGVGDAVITRLFRWQRLFARAPSGLLDDAALRGLIGEVLFLTGEAIPRYGVLASVRAWVGPEDAARDFVFDDRHVEVKATRPTPQSVKISSLQQLDDAGVSVFLWTCPVELLRDQGDSIPSVADMIAALRTAVEVSPEASDRLDELLWSAGYRDHEGYRMVRVRRGVASCYQVDSDFPRIRRTQFSAGVLGATYDLSVSAIAPFLTASW